MNDIESMLPEDYVDLSDEQFDLLDGIVPKEVCHYTRMDTALEYILILEEIRLGTQTATNDPRESKFNLFKFDELDGVSGVVQPDIGTLEKFRVFCTTSHNNPFWEIEGNWPIDDSAIKYGVSHSRMWAQYAQNHKGMCLLFDGRKLDEIIRKELERKQCEIRCGFVKYDYDGSTDYIKAGDVEFQGYGRRERTIKSLMKHYKPNFLCKSLEWKTEHEFRWIVYSPDPAEIFIPIRGAIRAVIVGPDFPLVYNPSLKVLCERLGIPAGTIEWLNGKPCIDYFSIYRPES